LGQLRAALVNDVVVINCVRSHVTIPFQSLVV